MASPTALDAFGRLVDIMATLRGPGGCPWDREQTIDSLKPFVLEETYEMIEAIDRGDHAALCEELGDFVFEAVFIAQLETEAGHFTLADALTAVADKLVRRHPHVFGDTTVDSADEVAERWERLKKAEKGRASVMDGIPATLPALAYALKVQRKATSQGVDWRTLLEDGDAPGALGRRLLDIVDDARAAGDDPETELRVAAEVVRDRFRQSERK
jgi:MazG family protein